MQTRPAFALWCVRVCRRLRWACTYFVLCFSRGTGSHFNALPGVINHITSVCFIGTVGMTVFPAGVWWRDLWLPRGAEAREGGRPGISMSYRRTTSAWIPIMCQLFRMWSNCTVGKGPCGPLCCAPRHPHPGHPAKPSRILPPWPILPSPSGTQPLTEAHP